MVGRLLVGLAVDLDPSPALWTYVFWGLWWVHKGICCRCLPQSKTAMRGRVR